ncbi:MAG TPA: helix-turn-helix domain-containing protein [Solirubrobacterales bacterium]|nr:helix-turn-helix domain-containing protein [Solirubrobacterales bacterium]
MYTNPSETGSDEERETAAPAARWLEVVADPTRLGILRSLSRVDEATTAHLAQLGPASSQTLRRHLEALVCLGVVEAHTAKSDGETPGRPATRYSLPPDLRDSVRAILRPLEPESSRGGSLVPEIAA